MAVKSELAFNDVKQLLAIQLEILKKDNTVHEIETKIPATNECKDAQKKKIPQEKKLSETMDVVVDDTIIVDVLNPKHKTRRGRPQINTYKST
ncbi:hypothetical protein MKX01_020430 [Papaver californicum]|nr:hypothetical protein MKX01_020430 [Papaver californicum]